MMEVLVLIRASIKTSLNEPKVTNSTSKSFKNWSTALFGVFAIAYTTSSFYGPYSYSWLPKIVPMLILIGLAYISLGTSRKHFLFGLAFSTCGDVLLAVKQGELFVFGLGAFLIAHLFYIASLLPIEKTRLKSQAPTIALYLLFGLVVFGLLFNNLGALLLPVSVYMLVLLLMAFSTLISQRANVWLMLGGASFVLSDSLIGLNKFYQAIPASGVWIMATYYLAQYCLLMGMLKSDAKNEIDGVTAVA